MRASAYCLGVGMHDLERGEHDHVELPLSQYIDRGGHWWRRGL